MLKIRKLVLVFVLLVGSAPLVGMVQAATYETCSSIYNNGASDCQGGGADTYQYGGSCVSKGIIDSAKATCNARSKYHAGGTTYNETSGTLVGNYNWSNCSCNLSCVAAASSDAIKDVIAPLCPSGQAPVYKNSGSNKCEFVCETFYETYLTKYEGGTSDDIISSELFQDSDGNIGLATSNPVAKIDIEGDSEEVADFPVGRFTQLGTPITMSVVADIMKNLLGRFQNAVSDATAGFAALNIFNDGSLGFEKGDGTGATTITRLSVDSSGDLIVNKYSKNSSDVVTPGSVVNKKVLIEGSSSGKFVDGDDPNDAVYGYDTSDDSDSADPDDGQVGIGTDEPEAKLHVVGDVIIEDDGTEGGHLCTIVKGNKNGNDFTPDSSGSDEAQVCFDINNSYESNENTTYTCTTNAAGAQVCVTTNIGGAVISYQGLSTATDGKPSTGGYEAADALCSTSYTGSRVCTALEFAQAIALKPAVANLSGLASANNPFVWVNNGAPGYVDSLSNDCQGWTNESGSLSNGNGVYGSIFAKAKSGSWPNQFMMKECSASLQYACCK